MLPDDVAGSVLVSADPGRHVKWLMELAELEIDALYLHHVGQEQEALHRRVRRARAPPEVMSLDEPRGRAISAWKNAGVSTACDVETFLDWDGDGIGDLRRPHRTTRLPRRHRRELRLADAVPALSPKRDDGYDITDYYGVDERLGSLGDFVAMIRTAKDRGMRVIIDLVVNHTSDKHPWFRAARSSRDSRVP